ncbi:MAG: hypothetical protein JKY56_25565 [Kofleriaceae bacterium]|nr:hypothetical protein [Kofleriaceae bacterium]
MSIGPQVAAVTGGDVEPVSCETLKERNEQSRTDLPNERAPSTISHGQYTPAGGKPENLWSRSKGRVAAKYKSGGASGAPVFQRYKEGLAYTTDTKRKTKGGRKVMAAAPTNINCDGSTFAYRPTKSTNTSNPDTAHTESRILEDLFKGSGGNMSGTLVMAIDWPTAPPGQKESPCEQCERVICGAMKCGLTIVLCQKGEPVEQDPGKCPDDQSPK